MSTMYIFPERDRSTWKTFEQLKAFNADEDSPLVLSRGDSPEDTAVGVDEPFSPTESYSVSDGENYLHLTFDPDGTLRSGEQFGGNQSSDLADLLGLTVSEHDDEFEGLVWDDNIPESTPQKIVDKLLE